MELIHFLIDHRAEASDGFNFKTVTFNAASAVLDPKKQKGAAKTGKLKGIYLVIAELKGQSGFKWDEKHGVDIDNDSESVWDAYVVKHPNAKPFRNVGWANFAIMQSLMPSCAKGANVFHAGQDGDKSASASDNRRQDLLAPVGSDPEIEWEATPPPGLPPPAELDLHISAPL
ncbi:hypothetical protein BJV78DRAFT_1285926 [Lactifluus subvellereus]|nr:hypothetical protein BJV78DRAFT_1285926 [Lactifluus subvellereus]